MLSIIFTIVSGLITSFFIIYWGYIIYDIKNFRFKWHHVFIIFFYSFLFYYSVNHFTHILHTGSFLFSFILLHQMLFSISLSKICMVSFIICLIRCIIMLGGSLINYTVFCDHCGLNSIFINLITTIFILIFKNQFIRKVKEYAIYSNKSWISVVVVNFIIVLIFIFEISLDKLSYGTYLLFPICCLLYLLFSIYRFTCQKVTLNTYLTNYYEIFKFSMFMDDWIDNYKTKLYDTKNQLAVLKNNLTDKDKNITLYLNNLIEEKSHINYSWLACLYYFKIPGIKGFISYKIQEMKELGIEIELFISDSLEDSNINLNEYDLKNLYIIIGVLCDNAKEAAIASYDKTVTFQAYYENDIIHFLIANTYDKIISLKNIDDFGVTGHKNGCGTGLYIVHSIIENSNIFNKKTSVVDNFFIQEITITKYHQKFTI